LKDRLPRTIRGLPALSEGTAAGDLSDALTALTMTMESVARIARGKKPLPHSPDLRGDLLIPPMWGVGAIDQSGTEDASSDEEELYDEDEEDWDEEEWEEDDPEE